MLVLSSQDILNAVTCEQVIDCVEQALAIYESRSFVMPDRLTVNCGESNSLLLMPCVADGHVATKVLTLFPGNREINRPVIDGLVVLADQTDGRFLAMMDGKTITALRTGAVTGSSIRHLASADAKSVGLIGCGAQGFYQLQFACAVRDITQIMLFDIDQHAAETLHERLQGEFGEIDIQVANSTVELVEASDIVITATTARSSIFPDDTKLFEGKYFVAIGSFQPNVREYPDAIFRVIDKVWVDIDFAAEESGELMIPLESGLLKLEQLQTLGSLIQSGKPAQPGPNGTTFFKSVGMALFDLTTARLAHQLATENNLGIKVMEED